MTLFFNVFSGSVLLFLLCHGASGVGSDRVSVSVDEEDSVTLNTGVQTNQQEEIIWYFTITRIAQISGDQSKICADDQCKQRFRDRLKLDHQTGSLTIMNITNTHSGEYKLKIFSRRDSEKIFSVSVHVVSAAERDEVKRKSVKKGESVTFDPGVINNPNDEMTWYYNEILIAEITGNQSKICTDDQYEERFRDRLKLDHLNGSLTIMNTRNTDSGDYKLKININNSSFSISRERRFSVSVTDSGLSSGAAAGIVVVVLLLVTAVVTVAVIYRRRRRHAEVPKDEDDGV